MIISVSILDKHKPEGQRHVGTYTFEIDYPGDSHFDLLAVACPSENEAVVRARGLLGRLATINDIGPAYRLTTREGQILDAEHIND
jgi:hypothetical protein